MPRFAILTGTRHGEKFPSVIQDPAVGIEEQKKSFKDFARLQEHPEYAEIQLWTSDSGIYATRRLKQPKPAPVDPESEKAKAEAEQKAAAEKKAAEEEAARQAKEKAASEAKPSDENEGDGKPRRGRGR